MDGSEVRIDGGSREPGAHRVRRVPASNTRPCSQHTPLARGPSSSPGELLNQPSRRATAAITCRGMPRSERWMYPRGLIGPPGDIPDQRRPLQLYERGIWDPADQYWGEPDGMLEICVVEVISAGPRMQFELEQLLPGGEDPDAGDAWSSTPKRRSCARRCCGSTPPTTKERESCSRRSPLANPGPTAANCPRAARRDRTPCSRSLKHFRARWFPRAARH
jgi:hypothetical protein